MVIAVDFDGTIVTHEYPNIGKNIGAIHVLKRLIANGHQLILNTMRSGKELDEAVEYLKNEGIELYGINENPTQKEWTTSPKVLADKYIDDANVGCPILINYEISLRPFVNWRLIELLLEQTGILRN